MSKSVTTKPRDAVTKNTTDGWVHLTLGKEFSRLLYPNPVCFLCTASSSLVGDSQGDHSTIATIAEDSHTKQNGHRNVMVISWLTAIDNHGYFLMSVNSRRHSVKHLISSAAMFTLSVPTVEMKDLVLQVGGVSGKDHGKFGAVTSTEDTVTTTNYNVSMSKRKWRKLQNQRLEAGQGISGLIALPYGSFCEGTTMHSIEKKCEKNEHDVKECDHTLLTATTEDPSNHDDACCGSSDHLFVIQGTVAHMKCQIQSVLLHHHSSSSVNDAASSVSPSHNSHDLSHRQEDSSSLPRQGTIPMDSNQELHHVFLAKVVDAYCHEDYWDSKKLLFCAKEEEKKKMEETVEIGDDAKANNGTNPAPRKHAQTVPPFLTFLGSQTFSQVVPLPSSSTKM